MRPVLVVGDVQGDVERLREALAPHDEDAVDTIFLGDFFQGGRPGAGGGAAAAQLARHRRHSRHVLGNHDLFLLAVLEEERGEVPPTRLRSLDLTLRELWLSRRGDQADLDAVAADPLLEGWLRSLPLLLLLDDGTLVQHADDDALMSVGTTIAEVNAAASQWLSYAGGARITLRHVIGRHAFTSAERLDAYLKHFQARRLIHGHTPHFDPTPAQRHGGRIIGFDGRFSRFWGRLPSEVTGPMEATVGLLPPLP